EVVVAPPGEAAYAFLGLVADAEAHLVPLALGERDVDVDALAAAVVLDQADAPEQAQAVEVLARLVEQALAERLARLERHLAPDDLRIDLRQAADRDLAEDGRRPGLDLVANHGRVVAHVDPCLLLDRDARIAALAEPGAQDGAPSLVALLLEDV